MCRRSSQFLLWLAEGLGSGRIPVAPGTWGSLVGIAVFAGLLATGHLLAYLAGVVVLVGISVPICSRAEVLLNTHDPSSVVLDEIAAVPLCYAAWVAMESAETGALPAWTHFFQGCSLGLVVIGFALFRALDALKPPPISACQKWPAGWGVVLDDVVAGMATGILVGAIRWAGFGEVGP